MEDRTWATASYTGIASSSPRYPPPPMMILIVLVELSARKNFQAVLERETAPIGDEDSRPGSSGGDADGTKSAEALAPEFAFFGIFDGHNGHYVAEALQSSLYPLFRKMWEDEELIGCKPGAALETLGTRAMRCITASCAKIDRAILGHDLEKQRLLQAERLEENSDSNAVVKTGYIKKTLSFAGLNLI